MLPMQVVCETQSDWGYSLGIQEWQGATGEILGKNVEPLMGEKWQDFRWAPSLFPGLCYFGSVPLHRQCRSPQR